MASLLDVLLPYPIVVTLAYHLGLGDLVYLSRLNSFYRATLHGFQNCSKDGRPELQIGDHRTPLWENLKAKSMKQCIEPNHRPSPYNTRSCRLCSLPVCEACVIRESFLQRSEDTFHKRCRNMCPKCWKSGEPHQRSLYKAAKSAPGNLCACTAKDGYLCLHCKADQNGTFAEEMNICHKAGCDTIVKGNMGGRICLWCDLRIPRTRAETRREYDAMHLQARLHSTYERGEPDAEADLPEVQSALLDDIFHNFHMPDNCS